MVKEADCACRPEVPSINPHSSQEEKLDDWSLEFTILEQNGEDQRWRKGHPVGSEWWIKAMVPKCDICWDLETELKLSAPCLPFHILLSHSQSPRQVLREVFSFCSCTVVFLRSCYEWPGQEWWVCILLRALYACPCLPVFRVSKGCWATEKKSSVKKAINLGESCSRSQLMTCSCVAGEGPYLGFMTFRAQCMVMVCAPVDNILGYFSWSHENSVLHAERGPPGMGHLWTEGKIHKWRLENQRLLETSAGGVFLVILLPQKTQIESVLSPCSLLSFRVLWHIAPTQMKINEDFTITLIRNENKKAH